MPRHDKRARATGRLGVERGQRYAMLPEEVLQSPAYHAQPDWSRTVLVALACRFNGHNNGDLSLPFSEARLLGISAQWKLYAALRLLDCADLIVCTRRGMLLQGRKLPSLYALTWRGINQVDGITYDPGISACLLATNDWVRWTKPDDWKSIVKTIARENHGRSKLPTKIPDSTTLGNGRSTTMGVIKPKTAQPRWGKGKPSAAPSMVETSKTSGREHAPDTLLKPFRITRAGWPGDDGQ